MTKRLQIRIFPDGTIQAASQGISGKACTEYIRVLEEMLEAEAVESHYTPEYYAGDEVAAEQSAAETVPTQSE